MLYLMVLVWSRSENFFIGESHWRPIFKMCSPPIALPYKKIEPMHSNDGHSSFLTVLYHPSNVGLSISSQAGFGVRHEKFRKWLKKFWNRFFTKLLSGKCLFRTSFLCPVMMETIWSHSLFHQDPFEHLRSETRKKIVWARIQVSFRIEPA